MLNYSKIHSSINHKRTPKIAIANHLGIAESTFRSRLEKENFTPNDIERIADFFEKPIAYYFDKEENGVSEREVLFKTKVTKYECQECIEKQKKIDELERDISMLRAKYIDILEELHDKKTADGKCG